MKFASIRSLVERLEELPDPRSENNRLHPLVEVVVIAVCGVIAGAEGPMSIHRWSKAKRSWLGRFLSLPNGLPSNDCVGRVLSVLAPEAFTTCFCELATENLSTDAAGRLIAIDGKTLSRSFDRASGKAVIHMVGAWATANHFSLGQLATDAKSNEITAVPELLKMLEIQGCLVTIDAMGCQREIAKEIIDQGADYVLAAKENQPKPTPHPRKTRSSSARSLRTRCGRKMTLRETGGVVRMDRSGSR